MFVANIILIIVYRFVYTLQTTSYITWTPNELFLLSIDLCYNLVLYYYNSPELY
jgi:hypothetical protein